MEFGEENGRELHRILISDTKIGLGIKITGGIEKEDGQHVGIFVRKVLHGGAIVKHGTMKVGDEIIQINGKNVSGLDNHRVVELLRQAAAMNRVEIIFASDKLARSRFAELIALKRRKYIEGKLDVSPMSTDRSQEENLSDGNHIIKKICLMKNHCGVGVKVKAIQIRNFEGKLLQIESITVGSTVAEDGRMKCGDIFVIFNGINVINWKPEQLHSVFLREKLRMEPSIDIEFIPHNTNPKNIASAINSSRISKDIHFGPLRTSEEGNHDNIVEMKLEKEKDEAMESIPQSPVSDFNIEKYLPPPKRILQSCSNRRKLTIDNEARIKIHKLESALKYLGIIVPNSQEIKKLHEMLIKDENDMVRYGDFVEATKDVFHEQLKDLGLNKSALYFAGSEIIDHLQQRSYVPPMKIDKAVDTEDLEDSRVPVQGEEVSKYKKENATLHQNIKCLREEKGKLHESLSSYLQMLEKSRNDTTNLRNEIDKMQTEHDKVVKSLKDQINLLQKLKGSEIKLSNENLSDNVDELKTRASLIDCEYRKSIEIRKSQEEAIKCLLQVATNVTTAELLISESNSSIQLNSLIEESHNAIDFVKPLLKNEELPYGWEEATLPDGSKYFINHADRTTSWSDPRESEESKLNDVSQLDTSRTKQADDYPPLIEMSPSDSDTQDDL